MSNTIILANIQIFSGQGLVKLPAIPSLERYPMSQESLLQNKSRLRGSRGKRAVEADHSLPALQYPIRLIQRASHRLRHRQRNFRKQLGRKPES